MVQFSEKHWKENILNSDKELWERIPFIGHWLWKYRVYRILNKLNKAGARGCRAGKELRRRYFNAINKSEKS